MASHAVVDQAIGMVVALGRVTPEESWGRRGEIPAGVRSRLEDALDRYGPTQVPGSDPGRPPARGAGAATEDPQSHTRPPRRGGRWVQPVSASSSSRSRSKQPLSSRETCICEMPSCWAIRLWVIPPKKRR